MRLQKAGHVSRASWSLLKAGHKHYMKVLALMFFFGLQEGIR